MSANPQKTPSTSSPQVGLSEAQLSYLCDVLGVPSLIIPEAIPTHLAIPAPADSGRTVRVRGDLASSRLICLFHEAADWPLVAEHAEMAAKMIFAMKLDAADVLEVEWRGLQVQEDLRSMLLSAGSRPVLLFGTHSAKGLLNAAVAIGEFVDFEGVHVMPTYSLRELVAQPNLKKATWSHMQKVMKTLI